MRVGSRSRGVWQGLVFVCPIIDHSCGGGAQGTPHWSWTCHALITLHHHRVLHRMKSDAGGGGGRPGGSRGMAPGTAIKAQHGCLAKNGHPVVNLGAQHVGVGGGVCRCTAESGTRLNCGRLPGVRY